jgi:hypothetical protein
MRPFARAAQRLFPWLLKKPANACSDGFFVSSDLRRGAAHQPLDRHRPVTTINLTLEKFPEPEVAIP